MIKKKKKTLSKLDQGEIYLNIIKTVYDKPTANIICLSERLKAFSLKSGTGHGCPLPTLLFSTALKVLARAIRK